MQIGSIEFLHFCVCVCVVGGGVRLIQNNSSKREVAAFNIQE